MSGPGRPERTWHPETGIPARSAGARGFSDKAALSPEPRDPGERAGGPGRPYDRDTEPPELSGMIVRVLRSLVRRAEDGDIAALAELEVISRAVMDASQAAARGLVAGAGRYSWGEVGRELGVSRQAARQRFGSGRTGK